MLTIAVNLTFITRININMCVLEGKTYIHYFSKYEFFNLMLN